jgi:hypothetical protein
MSARAPDPAALLASVAGRYATLRSYRDEGEVVTAFVGTTRSPTAPDPDGLLAEVARWDAEMHAYRDAGEVALAFARASRSDFRFATRRPFRTHFVRPDRFRFEFRSNCAPFILKPESDWEWFVAWLEGGVPKSWWTLQPAIEERDSIFDPLGAAAGISSGASTNIPALLMPGSTSRSVLPPPDSVLGVEEDQVDGIECHRIEHRTARNERSMLWIETGSLLVRRLWSTTTFTQEFLRRQHEETRDVIAGAEVTKHFTAESKKRILERGPSDTEPFATETVTTFRPAADVEIEPESFAVVLPSKGMR